MKIDCIRLKNLASLEGELEVDFTLEPLKSAGIFAISGPTGSGKSTLLDALCLALYDKAPRFAVSADGVTLKDGADKSISQSDVRNILRRGSGEGYAEVEFIAVNGNRYRSRWSVRRARGKVDGSLQTQTMQVWNLTTGEELQGGKTELLSQLRTCTGLSYEQFTRTVLLAQNDFATFLKSKSSEKAELLEKLTGTEIYSLISQEIYSRSKTAESEMQKMRQLIEAVELLSEEVLTEMLQREDATKALLTEGEQLQKKMESEVTIIREYKVKQTELVKLNEIQLKSSESLKSSNQAFETKQNELNDFARKKEAMQPIVLKARELDTLLLAKQDSMKSVNANLKTVEAELAQAKKELLLIEKQYGDARQTTQQVLHSKALAYDLSQLTPEAIETIIGHYNAPIHQLEIECKQLLDELALYDTKQLGEESQQAINRNEALKSGLNAIKEKAAVELKINQLNTDLQKLKEEQRLLNEHLQQMKVIYENAQLTVGKSVESLRQELRSGEDCPVCGSKQHPYADKTEQIESLYQEIKKQYESLEQKHKENDKTLVKYESEVQHQSSRKAELETLLLQYTDEQCNEAWFIKQQAETEALLVVLKAKVEKYRELNAAYQAKNTALLSAQKEFNRIKDALNALQQAEERYRSTHTLYEGAQKRFLLIQAEVDKTRKDYDELQAARLPLLKGMKTDDALKLVDDREKELHQQLEDKRKAKDAAHAEMAKTEGAIEQVKQDLAILLPQYESINNQEGLADALTALIAQNTQYRNELSTLKAKFTLNEENKKRRADREEEYKLIENNANKWGKLNELLGSADGKKFKLIAQNYTLNLLLRHANKHLSYLSRRYRLRQIPDSLGLQVIDGDMCDEVRTVYSLSGGESFLISLALALGLSSLSSNSLKVESLFIDEGFGSLDADTLRIAMEALEMLQMQGRKIGVISHVQEMSERILVKIELKKQNNGRSNMSITH